MTHTIAEVRIEAGTATLFVAGRRSELRAATLPALRARVIERLAREASKRRETLLVDAHDPEHGQEWFTVDALGAVTLTDAPPAAEPAETVAIARPEPTALPAAPVLPPAPTVRPAPIASPAAHFPAQDLAHEVVPAPAPLEERVVVDAPALEHTVMRVRPRRVAVVALNTGQSFTIGNPVVVGRRPQPTAAMDEVFQVRDTSLTLSKNHARFYWDKGELYGVDLGSGNGVVITDATGAEHRQPVHYPFRIDDGARLELGDVVAVFTLRTETAEDVAQASA
jgi:hypothetical protein